eukprot:354114-Chlamydomonas_euryale.AAC.7
MCQILLGSSGCVNAAGMARRSIAQLQYALALGLLPECWRNPSARCLTHADTRRHHADTRRYHADTTQIPRRHHAGTT